MKIVFALIPLLTLLALEAGALSRPKTPGQVYHVQCAQKIQAPGLTEVCLSTVYGNTGRFITLLDARGNGGAYSIVGASAAPGRGSEKITYLELSLSGDVTNGTYKALSAKGIPFKAEQRFNARKGALIQLLTGEFTRVGRLTATNFQVIQYPQ